MPLCGSAYEFKRTESIVPFAVIDADYFMAFLFQFFGHFQSKTVFVHGTGIDQKYLMGEFVCLQGKGGKFRIKREPIDTGRKANGVISRKIFLQSLLQGNDPDTSSRGYPSDQLFRVSMMPGNIDDSDVF